MKDDIERKLNHHRNQGDQLVTSLTVIGELVQVSFTEGWDLHGIIEVLRRLDLQILHPIKELREWCIAVDVANDIDTNYGSSVTDRTHLAYALTYDVDYFLTHHGEVQALKVPPDTNSKTQVVDLAMLKRALS